MPGVRRKRLSDLDEDEDHSGAESFVSTSSKRARHARDASTASEVSVSRNGHRNTRLTQNGYDEEDYSQDVHQPGSIVRVTLKNFVTYTEAEFHLGPSLNMIIGPNGTGKSTLVCAICLGLGWSPQNLGRAKEIGEFVKHGSLEAEIEIELAAASGQQRNPITRRVIKKEGNKSAFFINGQSRSQKQVVQLARSFSIQIDNLCQFLPQDRVVEFAALNPVALLRETQRAAAPEHMVQWHDALKALRQEEKGQEVQQKNETDHLRGLQARQTATKEDVDRWNQRQAMMSRIKALERTRPIIETNLMKRQIAEMRSAKTAAKSVLQQLTADAAPARKALESAEAYQAQTDEVSVSRRRRMEAAKTSADRLKGTISSEEQLIKHHATEVLVEKAEEKKRKLELKRLQGVIANLERQMQDQPEECDEEAFTERRRQIRSKKNEFERKTTEIKGNHVNVIQQARELQETLASKRNDKSNLNTRSGQQQSLLAKVSTDTAKAWEWIEKNRESLNLEGEIHGPPILTCAVKDNQFADVVESQMGLSDFTAITCTNGADARRLSDKLFGGLKLHAITIRTVPKPLTFYHAPVTQDELHRYGFDGWVIDLVQGPEPVLAMLCDSSKLHRAAFATKELSDSQYQALQASPISNWVAGRDKYRITRRYNQSSTMVTNINSARFFTDQPVDAEESRKLDGEIRQLERQIGELKEQSEELKEEMRQVKVKDEQAQTELDDVRAEQQAQRNAFNEWQALPGKKATKEDELRNIETLMSETGLRMRSSRAKAQEAAIKVASLTLEYARAVAAFRKAHESLVEASVCLIEAESELTALRVEHTHILRQLDEKKEIVRELTASIKALTLQHNAKCNKHQEVLDALSDEEKNLIEEYQNIATIEELITEIEAVQNRLGMMADGNPNAVKAYERREQDIASTEAKLGKIAEDLEATQQQIQEIRSQWEPELDALVGKISDGFSHNFQQIGCAGQVSVYKDEDFENWSIQIQVRFRENETMSILTSQRQSGGERAVSTIFYLMALQDMARSPFRVVDEINQGMDPRNERMVHERMVDIACRERTSQYFLITPKLLNDLKFHPKMKVHCIASGEHMPVKNDGLDFSSLATLALRVNKGITAA
ncbi:P-loop containing nucleoside triphosphate hydrolase protein [Polyplosphaeria fusca]|uniref:Structural maintenance of chromosomes protein 5 n=1 Tax=Polyplosphaeria fusca TaxID=682080 RepID=A0A9P4V5M7_9PLEO|nr:P-loop containing nucleoside triphosphate hydrolase protein [Polyplosphaeria fusca]